MINIFHRSREFVEKHKQHHHIVLAVLALVIAGTGAYTYRHEVASAATFYFNQSTTGLGGGGWTGLDTATPLATHTSNQSNWSKYSSKSTYINADANGISLPSTAKPITDDGVFSTKTDYAVGISPRDVAVSPDGASVYIANNGAGSVTMYARNTTDGTLSGRTDYTSGTNSMAVIVSPDGTSVYVANNGVNTVSRFSRDTSTGTLSAKIDYATGAAPQDVAISLDGTSVYVTNYTSNTISMFPRNTSTGALSARSDYTTGTTPWGVTISPDGASVYVANSASASVSMFTRNTTTGTLSVKTDYTTGSTPRGVAISSDGASLYVVNAGSTTVSMFARDAIAGTLSTKTDYATGGTPTAVVVSPDGTVVYAVNYSSVTLSMFTRNTTTGVLSTKTDYTTGANPYGITVSPGSDSVYTVNISGTGSSMYSRGASGGATGFEYGANSNTSVTGTGSLASVRLGDTSTGGTATTSGAYTIRTFTGSGTFTPVWSGNLEALVVAGGGGGGRSVSSASYDGGGGGGAGGAVYNSAFSVTASQAYTVTIGAGGSGGGVGGNPATGGNSVFSTITATGGGKGSKSTTGFTGGSGGGGLGSPTVGAAGGSGTAGQGYAGGSGFLAANPNASGGGGGGAGATGSNGASAAGGNGGSGIVNPVVGSTAGQNVSGTYYIAGGGGGGVWTGTAGSSGGAGGGAPGGGGTIAPMTATANTGGGGGSGDYYYGGGNGGSGVVVLRYPSPLSGTFTSAVIDTGAKSNFTTLAYTATLNGQTLTVDIRAGDSSTAPAWGSTDANWTSTGLTSVANGGDISSLGAHRYVQYRANLSTNDGSISPTLDNVIINSSQYSLGGNLTSSVYDTIDATNILAGVSWTSGSTSGTETVALQIRSSADNSTWTSWCGATSCNNTDTFTTSPATITSSHPIITDGTADRYVQYKVILASGGSVTPSVTQVVMTYVVNAPPAVGNIVATQNSNPADTANYGKVSFSFDASDSDTTTGSPANQRKLTPTLYEYSTNGGGAWATISSGLSANAYDVIALTGDHLPPGSPATTTTAVTWIPPASPPIALTANAKIRVTVTDGEAANATAVGTMSGTFTLDSTAPVVSTANLNSSGAQDVVSLTATDGSAMEYRLCNDVAFTGCAVWSPITSGVATSTNWTATGAPNAETVYFQVRDLYGNITSRTIVAPAMPANFTYSDISNTSTDSYREFLSWASSTPATFFAYKVYYNTTGASASYTLLSTIYDQTQNYYLHNIATATSSTHYYKMTSVSLNGDISNFTLVQADTPDGSGGVDVTPPYIPIAGIAVSSVTNKSANITFSTYTDSSMTTGELATSSVRYASYTGSAPASCPNANSVSTNTFTVNHSVYVTGLAPNTNYAFCVLANDVTGNISNASSVATVGGTFTTAGGPIISNVTEREITDVSATIFWNTSTSADSAVYYSTTGTTASINASTPKTGTIVTTAGTDGVYQHQIGLTGLTSGLTYYFKVVSTDASSNSSTDDNSGRYYSFVTLSDTTPPTITGTSTPVLASNAAVIVWQTDELATSKVDYGLSSSAYSKGVAEDSSRSIYHVMALSSGTSNAYAYGETNTLIPETTYYYRVTSKDAANNSSTSEGTFVTPSTGNVTIISVRVAAATEAGVTPDTTAPSISGVTVSDITPFSAVVRFSTDEDTNAFVEYGKDTAYGDTAGDKTWARTHTIKLRGLTLGTEYHVKVSSNDKAGNAGTSADQIFKTTFLSENLKDMANVENIEQYQKEIENAIESILPSLVPPFVTKPQITDVTESSANVTFKSNIKAFPVVVYAEDGAYDETKENPYVGEVSNTTEKATSHELLLTGLKGNTKYHIQARAFSLPKVIGKSLDVIFITKASKIAGSIVERKKDSFTVVWTTDQPTTSIVEFKNIRSGITERKTDDAKKTSHSMKIENLPPGTAYEVNLSGLTEQGNIAEAGSPLSVTTSRDVTEPAISGFKVDNALVPGRTDRIQTIVTWVTDEPSNGTVYYEEGAGTAGDTKELANKNEVLDSYIVNHSVILPNLKPGTIYRLKVVSSDDSGNEGSFGPRTVITPRQTESITDIIFKNFEDSFKFLRKI